MKQIACFFLLLALIVPSFRVSAADTAQTDLAMSVGADESQRNLTWYSTSAQPGEVLLWSSAEAEARHFISSVTKANDADYYSHKLTLSGLLPATQYAYQLVNEGQFSPVYTFTTAPSGDFSFVFAGDPQLGESKDPAKDRAGWALALERISEHAVFSGSAFLLSAGDHVDEKNNESHFDDLLHHAELQGIAMANVIGNHEASSEIFPQHFYRPNESAQYGLSKAGGNCWFVYNDVLFFLLNSNNKNTQEHRDFMESVLAQNPNCRWKIVALHHSLYTVANHAYDKSILSRREELVPLFDELGIDVVLSGHDHVYCRSYLMDGLQPLQSEDHYDSPDYRSATNAEGVLYITANSSSGSKTYDPKEDSFPYCAAQHQYDAGELSRVDITDSSFTIRTYRTDTMQLVDSFTLYRREEKAHPFTDVSAESWYQKAVQYNYTHGLVSGVEEDLFLPEGAATRAMAVAILYRMHGRPEGGQHSFTDVPADAYYSGAVAWAAEAGIVAGIGEDLFAPDRAITRQELVSIFSRYAAYLGQDVSATEHTQGYADAALISDYARAPMNWALQEGLIVGISADMLSPQGRATRAQMAQLMMRLYKRTAT